MKNIYQINPNNTVTIFLNQGLETIIDAEDLPLAYNIGGSWTASYDGTNYYVIGSGLRLHRLIAQPGQDLVVDHINRDTLDNRRSNLRIVTQQQNCYNISKKANTSSVYKGVTWETSRNRWRVKIKHRYKTVNLGRYKTETEAALAYDAKAKELFGPFANLNFPENNVCVDAA